MSLDPCTCTGQTKKKKKGLLPGKGQIQSKGKPAHPLAKTGGRDVAKIKGTSEWGKGPREKAFEG